MDTNNGTPTGAPTGLAQESPQKNDQVIEISITLPTQTYFISGIRDFTLNLIKNMSDFSEQWAYRFQSIVDELCNNAIEHGSKPGDMITIVFQNVAGRYIQILVSDHGSGNTHIKAEEIGQLVNARKEQNLLNGLIRGRGLPKIVSEWTDELEFINNAEGGITVRVKKHLNDPKFQQATVSGLENPTHIVLN